MLIARRLSVPVIAVLMLTLLTSTLFAGTTGKISGVVVDAGNGEPLPGVAVQLEGTTIGAQTNINGEYVILNIPPKTYTVKVRLVGACAGCPMSQLTLQQGIEKVLKEKIPQVTKVVGVEGPQAGGG